MKSDKEIWKESLTNKDAERLFDTVSGGKHSKSLPKRNVFKQPKEKKMEDKIKKLEEITEKLINQLRKNEQAISEIKRQIKLLRNKKSRNIQQVKV